MPIPMEDYFATRAPLLGVQSPNGDQVLVLRSGSVFRATNALIRGLATIQTNQQFTSIISQNIWYKILGFTESTSTPALTFANDEFTYIGPDQIYPAVISVNCNVVKELTTSTAEFEVAIFANDVQLSTQMSVSVSDDGVTSEKSCVTCSAIMTLSQGDVIDVRIRNRSGTENFKLEDVQLVIQQ